MTDVPISTLPSPGSPLSGGEFVPIIQNGVACKIPIASIAALASGASGPWSVSVGGTGREELGSGLLYGDTTAPVVTIAPGNGASVLVGIGAGAQPQWKSGATGQYMAIDGTGTANWVTVNPAVAVQSISFDSTGLTPNVPVQGEIVVGGQLNAASGGTGNSTLTTNALLVGNGTSATKDTGPGQTGELLVGSTGSVPAWVSAAVGSGQLLQSNSGASPSWMSAPTNGAVMVGSSGPAWLSAGAEGYILTISSGAPAWAPIPGTGVSTISFGTTGLTPNSATNGVVTVAGTLATGNGGTGLTGFTAANNALYSTSSSALAAGTLPTAAGGTGLTGFTAANRAIYSISSSALTAGILPIAAGGTGTSSVTGSGSPVFSTSPTVVNATLTTPTVNGGTLSGSITATGATISSPTLSSPTMTGAVVDGINGGSIAGYRNRVLNGGMDIDQRHEGAAQTITAAAALAATVDGWLGYCTGANATGQRISSSGASGSPSVNAYRFTGAASVTAIGLIQRITSDDSFDLAGQTATISVNLANSVLTSVAWNLSYANTADTWGTLALPTVTSIASGTFTVSSTLTRYSAQVSIPSGATTGLQLRLSVGAQTSGTWTIGNVQIETGTQATPFERITMQSIISRCQRRYEKSYSMGTAPGSSGAAPWPGVSVFSLSGVPVSVYTLVLNPSFSVAKRVNPTITNYSPQTGASGKARDYIASSDVTATAANAGTSGFDWFATVASTSSPTVYSHWTADAECYS